MVHVDAANTGHNPDESGPSQRVTDWWHFTEAGVGGEAVVVDGTVYAGGEGVYALDTTEGTKQWEFTADSDRVFASPAVVDDTVYVGNYDGEIYALDAADGTEQWRFQLSSGEDTPYINSGMSPLTVADGTVYASVATDTTSGTVYALDTADGAEQWQFPTDGKLWSAPAVAEGAVYVVSDGLYAIDAESGFRNWHLPGDDAFGGESAPAVADGTVFAGSVYAGGVRSSPQSGDLFYALDTADGTEQWRFDTGGVRGSPAVAAGTVYVASVNNGLFALDVADGTQQWNFQPRVQIYSSPIVVDGVVYIGCGRDTGVVYGLDATDGSLLWDVQVDRPVRAAPAVADDMLFVGSTDSDMFALAPRVIPRASYSPAAPNSGTTVTFDGSETMVEDAASQSVEYEWAFGSDAEFTERGRQVTRAFDEPGRYTVRLRVSTPEDARTTTVDVPVATPAIRYTPETTTTGADITFDASNSVLPVPNATYEWAFGSDSAAQASGPEVTHRFTDPGEYTVRLNVTGGGQTWTTTTSVSVTTPDAERSPAGPSAQPTDVGGETPTVAGQQGGRGFPIQSVALGLLGVGGISAAGVAAYRRWAGGADAPRRPREIHEAAKRELRSASTARSTGEYPKAVSAYTTAIDTLTQARERATDGELVATIKSDLADAEHQLELTRGLLEQLTAVRDPLETAESSLQTAITEHVQQELTPARRDYRRAKDHYEQALDALDTAEQDVFAVHESVTVPVSIEADYLPERLLAWPEIPDSAHEKLSGAGVGTLSDIQSLDEGLITELLEHPEIGEELADRLRVAAWWHGEAERTFTSRQAIERQRAFAQRGQEMLN